MKLPEAIKQAVKNNDAEMAGKIVDQLRDLCGMDYERCAEYFKRHSGISEDQFEALMYEAESCHK